jgi:hypothetical protein
MGGRAMVALDIPPTPTLDAIDRAYVEKQSSQAPRGYLGASIIGKPCERALWYGFRLGISGGVSAFSGRMLRLFETGHLYEPRLIEWLRMTGATVHDSNPDTGDQWAVNAINGHFRGHMDGLVEGLLEAPKAVHVAEFKTHNAKSFAQLQRHGVAIAKPEHVAQMQVYMHLGGYTRAVYLAANKDTDDLYLERIHYDVAHANAIMAKAERIIYSDSAPLKISDDAESFACRFCDFKAHCHYQAWSPRNCRTCGHSKPGDYGPQWDCERHGNVLSFDDQRAGCPHHLYIPSLVAGDQIDADPHAETVTYLMLDGSHFVDGADRAVSP